MTINYTVQNGGSGTMAQQTATYGQPYTAPECTFTAPTGYSFSHWYDYFSHFKILKAAFFSIVCGQERIRDLSKSMEFLSSGTRAYTSLLTLNVTFHTPHRALHYTTVWYRDIL